MIVTFADYFSTYGCCCNGGRAWAKRNGIDWNSFRKDGLPLEFLEKFDHVLIKAVIETARKRIAMENGDA